MAVRGISLTLHLLFLLRLLLLLPVVTTQSQTILNITNRCPYTVWPAAFPVGGGRRLEPGKTWTLKVPYDTRGGSVWARTGCSFDGKGDGSCQTGDCQGLLACNGDGQPPYTSAQFSLNQYNNNSFFGISLYQGFNVPMEFLPMPSKGQGGSGCIKGPHCVANITSQCPSELKAPGGCNSACTVFQEQNNDMYCCYGTPCESNKYSAFFVRMCPEAISYSSDAVTETSFSCPWDTDYQVIFCPPINLTSSPPSSPNPADQSLHTGPAVGTSVSIAIAGAIVLIVTFIFFILRRRRTRRHHEMEEEEAEFGQLQGTPMRFTFQQLEAVTEQFKDKLGEGGFGSVFEGQLGEERIAVKRLDRAGQGKREFLAEVQTIGSIHHINLVRLFGFCAEKSHRLLVYEYMPKGSLDRWIYGRHENSAPPLEWRVRCKIIADIAKGLSYLHEDCMKRIAHLNVKPQNILLDDDFNAKLSDFGLCKLIDRDMSQVVTRMRGTPGYLAPEWLTSQITEKADVYSFGVVVMEIVSGRKNLDTSLSEESIHLITLLEEKVKSNHLEDLIDKGSNDMQAHERDVIQMMKLAMWCLQIDCKGRPKMSEVVKVLEGTMDAESNIDHNFVATNEPNFGIAGNVNSSAPPVASDVSGPR
ncbi:G-type lectin S-receptor-like serine/threonine-protein kinase SD2-5 [Triticum dicoccoides]|uniref:G-type lectin S-receptor-like serine/threonine-protein kinase SD2-5 n=1 Tax=Triticum dicoccoides TaxID=85692 RepID=UPI00188F0689|nr:G-type lectin S-receptor-like serine/threonine-protein kinase SD2-5 [Triticum dicoccoides]